MGASFDVEATAAGEGFRLAVSSVDASHSYSIASGTQQDFAAFYRDCPVRDAESDALRSFRLGEVGPRLVRCAERQAGPRHRAIVVDRDGVHFAKAILAKNGLKDGDYTMDHTAIVYLMDKDGRFVSPFNLKRKPEVAAAEFVRVTAQPRRCPAGRATRSSTSCALPGPRFARES